MRAAALEGHGRSLSGSDPVAAWAAFAEAKAVATEFGLMRLLRSLERSPLLDPAATDEREKPGGLSAREAEVLALVAAGYSNQRIADHLVLSLNTVIRHVSNIYRKIDAANRAEATMWAAEHGVRKP